MCGEYGLPQTSQPLGLWWQRQLVMLRLSLETSPSHPSAWLFQIRMRILAYMVARYGGELIIPARRSLVHHGMGLRWEPPAVEAGRPPRTGRMIRPFLLDIAEANGHLCS